MIIKKSVHRVNLATTRVIGPNLEVEVVAYRVADGATPP